MRRFCLAAAVFAIGTASASAATEFRGSLCITKTNAACSAGGWGVGDCLLMRFSPPNVGTNGPKTELSLFGQAFADNYSLASGTLIGTTMKPVSAVHIGREGYAFSTTARFTLQTPKVPTTTTESILIRGSIANFGDTTGCTVTFRATGVNRP